MIKDKRPGLATSSECYRPGKVYLVSNAGEFGVMPTTCKTWRCKGCRDRMISLFKARVSIGCSSLGRCAFITGTYKADVPQRSGVEYVAKDWKALWRLLPNEKKSLKWLRVMEVTKRGTPHWHMVAGPIPDEQEVRCFGGKLNAAAFLSRMDDCRCVSHTFARAWFKVTHDSFVVYATPVVGAEGAGAYMAKYLAKTFGSEDRHKALGMKRRWSSSRGWPGSGRMQLEPTMEGGWKQRDFAYGKLPALQVDGGTFRRVGNENTLAYFEKKKAKRGANNVRRLLNA